MPNSTIFISYSRKDTTVVGPLVQFLRLSANDIFRDLDNIPFGLEWRAVISTAIQGCDTFVLFWCRHAAQSQEVRNESDQAIACHKPIVPVLLDDTVLPPDLGKYHGIDLRTLVSPHEERYIERQVSVQGMRPGASGTMTVEEFGLPEPEGLRYGCVLLKQELATIIGITPPDS